MSTPLMQCGGSGSWGQFYLSHTTLGRGSRCSTLVWGPYSTSVGATVRPSHCVAVQRWRSWNWWTRSSPSMLGREEVAQTLGSQRHRDHSSQHINYVTNFGCNNRAGHSLAEGDRS